MIKKLIVIFLLSSQISFAQYKQQPTQFDSFITRPVIEWAAYANDYLNFKNYNLNKLLYNRFAKNEIKASLPFHVNIASPNYVSSILKDSLDRIILEPAAGCPMYDSNGNPYPIDFSKIEPYKIDFDSSTFTFITQILYIENGILKSYIPLISPSIVRITTAQTKQFIGYTDYLSTCYNYKYNYLAKENNSNIFLGKSASNFNVDSIQKGSQLKQLYGRNMIETLMRYKPDQGFDLYNYATNKKVNFKEIYDSILSPITLPKPVNYYESDESLDIFNYGAFFLHLEDFKEVQLIQEWYYDYAENIIFNKVQALNLCAKNEEKKEITPIFKIVFR